MIKSEDSAENNFLTKKKFSKMFEAAVHELNLNYIDAIVHLAEKNNMELEDMNKLVTPLIKQMIEFEGHKLIMLP